MRPPAKRDKIVNEFKARILSGVAAPGSRMPTEQELAHRLNVAELSGTPSGFLKKNN
ncbi:MAG: GntR family transcriptional regulator [Victivallales bacterium]